MKFNKPITMSGNSVNAGVTGNYTINGATLPTGTQIRANIAGYDNHDGVTDSITIILPEGNVNTNAQSFTVDATNAMLNISRAITSTTGETLTNGGMIRLPFQYGSATDSDTDKITSLTTATDAVWGNDVSEQLGTASESIKTRKEYYQQLKNALADEKYRRVIIRENLDLTNFDSNADQDQKDLISVFGRSRTLTINRAVDIDLTDTTINGNVVVSTTDAVDKVRIYSEVVDGAKIIGYNATNNNDGATLTVNAGSVKDFEIQGVTVQNNSNKYAVNINDTYKASFHNKGTIDGPVRITDTNSGAGFTNEGNMNGSWFVIDTDGEVNLNGNFTGLRKTDSITVNRAAKLTFGNAETCDISGLDIHVAAANTRVIFTKEVIATNTNFTSEAKNVRVELPEEDPNNLLNSINWYKDNGEIITVNKDNKEVNTNKIDPDVTGVQKALDDLNVLTGKVGDATSTTITAGAITGGSLNTADLTSTIKASIRDKVTSVADNEISVNYRLQTTNVLTQSGAIISVKAEADRKENTKDEIRVVVSCKGYSVTKYIVVSDK